MAKSSKATAKKKKIRKPTKKQLEKMSFREFVQTLDDLDKKTVSFILDKNQSVVPEILKKFNPIIDQDKLLLNYDKNTTKLKEIINILNDNKISFNEINTHESDLEDVFIELIKND